LKEVLLKGEAGLKKETVACNYSKVYQRILGDNDHIYFIGNETIQKLYFGNLDG
jgi:hypothetical protein